MRQGKLCTIYQVIKSYSFNKRRYTTHFAEFIHNFDEMDIAATDDRTLFSGRLATFFVALKEKFLEKKPIFPAIMSFLDAELSKKDINIDLTKLLKRIYIEFDTRKPMLIVESGALDTWWLLAKLTLKHIKKKPQLLGKLLNTNIEQILRSNSNYFSDGKTFG